MDSSALVRQLCAEIGERNPVDERERESIARFLAEVARLDDPLDEHADPVHITASAVVVGPSGVVLHKHKVNGLWLQPGGHVDPGETPWDAALRETAEETGLPVRHAPYDGVSPPVVHVDVHPGPHGHIHLDVRYLIESDDSDPDPPAGESQDVLWFDWDSAIERADPGLQGALRALRP